MMVLDTDHLTHLQRNSEAGIRLWRRLRDSTDSDIATTIINAEEQVRARLAGIKRRAFDDEVPAYTALLALFEFYSKWTLLPFDRPAAQILASFPTKRIRDVGPMDCKIAAIVLAHGATLLSSNLRDFQQVPGLRVEDWLREQVRRLIELITEPVGPVIPRGERWRVDEHGGITEAGEAPPLVRRVRHYVGVAGGA